MMFSGGVSGLLLAAAAGYWVLERAESHKRGLRRVGRWVGGAIIVVAIVGSACRIAWLAGGPCPWLSGNCSKTPMTMPRVPSMPAHPLP